MRDARALNAKGLSSWEKRVYIHQSQVEAGLLAKCVFRTWAAKSHEMHSVADKMSDGISFTALTPR
eukprot:4650596-Pleurochrysis_carterae.AAC.1